MNDIFNKLSSYNLFNYLFPGIIFVILSHEITDYNFIQENIVLGVFLYYFIGLVISRFGSLIVGHLLRKYSFLQFEDYEKYVAVSKKDAKLELFSEINNMYRTLCSLLILLPLLKIYNSIEKMIPSLKNWNVIILITLLLVLFLFSYRKQTNFIRKRIEANE